MPKTNQTQAADAAPEESKRDKFKRLCGARVVKAQSAIQSVGKTANKSAYEFTADDIAKMEKVLTNEVSNVIARYRAVLDGKRVEAPATDIFE